MLDSKDYDLESAWYGTRCSRRTWGHAGYLCSIGFADPENRLVIAVVFNGMTEDEPALHGVRMRETIDGIYADLGLGPS